MSNVTLRFRTDGSLQINPPPPVTINRIDQTITWQLMNGSWLPNGIDIDMQGGPTWQAWPGQQAALVDGNYVANANDALPPGEAAQFYHYTINVTGPSGEKFTMLVAEENPDISVDPIIDNQPWP